MHVWPRTAKVATTVIIALATLSVTGAATVGDIFTVAGNGHARVLGGRRPGHPRRA